MSPAPEESARIDHAALLERARAGDAAAREELFRGLAFGLRVVASRHLRAGFSRFADDAIQEALIVVHDKLDEIEESVSGFAYRCLRNVILRIYKDPRSYVPPDAHEQIAAMTVREKAPHAGRETQRGLSAGASIAQAVSGRARGRGRACWLMSARQPHRTNPSSLAKRSSSISI